MKVLKLLFSTFALLALVSCASNTDSASSYPKDNSSSGNSSADTSSGNSSSRDTNSSSSSSSSGSSSNSSIHQDVYYTVTFLNYDETPLQEVRVLEGEEAHYTGATPTKDEDDEFKYEFDGWDKDLTNITSNVTTKATYKAVAKENWGPIHWLKIK